MSCELLASRIGGRLWAAIRERGQTVELRLEPLDPGPRAGSIVKGRVTTVVDGLGAAFVDLGAGRAAFLHVRDLPGIRSVSGRSPIGDRLRAGQDLLVQVEREGRSGKGPRVTGRLTLPGRRLVLVPELPRCTVSRRIDDRAERSRLTRLLERLRVPGVGWIARSAAEGVTDDRIAADADALVARWAAVRERGEACAAPAIVLPEAGLLEELLRDAPGGGFERIVVDDEGDRRAAIAYLSEHDRGAVTRVAPHAGRVPLLEASGVDLDIERALSTQVALPSGGHLVIEETEALVSIDVNSGKHVGRGDAPERTISSTNLEAAREIPRQLRLRGLGGIVVVDLIDMARPESRAAVVAAFREALRADPSRTRVVGPNEVGLLALTREAPRPGLGTLMTRECVDCRGSGRVRRS